MAALHDEYLQFLATKLHRCHKNIEDYNIDLEDIKYRLEECLKDINKHELEAKSIIKEMRKYNGCQDQKDEESD